MLASRHIINLKLQQGRARISYQISADNGSKKIIKSATDYENIKDMIGIAMNVCAKNNSFAMPDTMIIGRDLFEIVKNAQCYCFKNSSEFLSKLTNVYPLYTVSINSSDRFINLKSIVSNLHSGFDGS